MHTLPIHPSFLVIGAIEHLGRAGVAASVSSTNVDDALSAARDLLTALTSSPPTPLGPADMWTREDMRTALADRDIGAVYRVLGRHGIAQRQIAAATGQSQSEISEIIAGRQVQSFAVLARIADGLGIRRDLLGLDARPLHLVQ